MKRYLVLTQLILLLCVTQQVYSQISVGGFGMLNSSNLSGNPPADTKYSGKTSFGGGLLLDYKFNEEVTLSFQPNYIQKGTTVSYDLPSNKEQRDSLTINFSYFSMPLMVKVFANQTVYVSGGIAVDFLQEARTEMVNQDKSNDVKEFTSSLDLTANFGIGFNFQVNSLTLFFEGRFSQGLLNISEFAGSDESSLIPQFKNTGMQLLAGFLYPL